MNFLLQSRTWRPPTRADAVLWGILWLVLAGCVQAQSTGTPAPGSAAPAPAASGGTIHGLVKSGNMPLPGVPSLPSTRLPDKKPSPGLQLTADITASPGQRPIRGARADGGLRPPDPRSGNRPAPSRCAGGLGNGAALPRPTGCPLAITGPDRGGSRCRGARRPYRQHRPARIPKPVLEPESRARTRQTAERIK